MCLVKLPDSVTTGRPLRLSRHLLWRDEEGECRRGQSMLVDGISGTLGAALLEDHRHGDDPPSSAPAASALLDRVKALAPIASRCMRWMTAPPAPWRKPTATGSTS